MKAPTYEKQRQFLVKGIWLYFILLIFEGALRKWVLPSLANPLLIVRDPVAITLLLYAWYYNIFPANRYVIWMYILTLTSFFASLLVGHTNFFVAVYGARIYLIHFPLVFLIGGILNRNDVIHFGRIILWLSIPMAVLVTLQFYSPQSAWVNRGVGGDLEGAGFGGAMGYFRPPGTFSFTNGLVAFFSLAAAYIFYFWLQPKYIKKSILIISSIALIFMIPFSISRSLLFTIVIIILFFLATMAGNLKNLGKILVGLAGFMILGMILIKTGWLDTPIEVFSTRFEQAAESEGGLEGTLGERYLGNKLKAVLDAGGLPFFGYGLGLGTNAGAVMLGQVGVFLVAEDEWQRIVGEMGALIGIGVIFIRLSISFKLLLKSYRELQMGKVLPWMLFSFFILKFPQGAWTQPSLLGFCVMIAGFLIASFNEPEEPTYQKTVSNKPLNE